MASLTQWTWVWVNSRNWWWTGRPGVLWSMGSQRIGHDWVTELNRRYFSSRSLVDLFKKLCWIFSWNPKMDRLENSQGCWISITYYSYKWWYLFLLLALFWSGINNMHSLLKSLLQSKATLATLPKPGGESPSTLSPQKWCSLSLMTQAWRFTVRDETCYVLEFSPW